jgi:gliding motility-associated-like protein
MKQLLLFLTITCLITTPVFSQVVYDDCENAIDLGEAPSCQETIYSSIDATTSTITTIPAFEIPSCWTTVGNDVWVTFTVPSDGSYTDFQLTVNGVLDGPNSSAMIQPQLAVYRGECLVDGLNELACGQAGIGDNSIQLDVEGLTPGSEYFLRISTYSATATPNDGDFQICVDTIPVSLITATADDEVLCGPQSSTQLTATSSTGELSFYSWSPANSLSTPNESTTLAFPFQTTTYTVTAFDLGGNLVENGDFEAGDVGFTSGYTNVPGNGSGMCQGCYSVNTTIPSLWTQCAAIDNNMMVMNGAPEANVNVWCQEVDVTPNTDYFFSTQLQTINSPVPELQYSVNGDLLGTSFLGSWACNVVEYYETINSGVNTTLEICIVNQSISAGGNDFSIDNINFSTYTESVDSVTIQVSNVTAQIANIVEDDCFADCSGQAEVMANGGIGDYTYEWQNGQTTALAIGLCAGTYSVSVTDEVGCIAVQEITIGQNLLEVSVSSLVSPCEVSTVGTAIVSASGGMEPYEILWDNGEVTATAENLSEGLHEVMVTDGQGCQVIGEVVIVLASEGFGVTLAADMDFICPGETVIITAETGGGDEFFWSTEETGSSISVTLDETSYFTVAAKRLGSNIILNGDFSAGNTGFSSEYLDAIGLGLGGAWGPLSLAGTYAVDNDASNVHSNFSPCTDHTTGTGNMLIVNGSETQNLEVWCQTVTVEPGTSYQFSTWITSVVSDNPAVLQFSVNDQLLGDPFEITLNSCSWANFFEIWEADGVNSAEICIVNQNTGGGGNDFALDDIELVPVCIAEAGITVQVSDLAGEIEETSGVSCETGFGTATVVAVDGQEPFTYLWTNGETTSTATMLEEGTHTVTITGAWGCTQEISVGIDPSPFVVIDEFFLTPVSCGPPDGGVSTIIGGSAEFFAGAGVAPFMYSIDGGASFQEGSVFNDLAAGEYEFVLSDANQCTYDTTFQISDVELPSVEIMPSEENGFCDANAIDLSLETTGQVDSIVWSTGDVESVITIMESGIYTVDVYSSAGCFATASFEIDDCSVYRIPDVFTPNGDGFNDEFKVYSAGGIIVKEMKIFNRWGELVHNATVAWNGDYKGKPHQSDLLLYLIVLETAEGEVIETGEITLLR